MDRDSILQALRKFARQRPRLEFCNYGDVSAYRAEASSITRDLRHVEELLRAVSWREGITAEALLESARSSYSGRLTIKQLSDGSIQIDYCPGQYFPTEYRRAVCAILASALWDYWRDIHPDANGDTLRSIAKRELSPAIARRWFS